MQGAIEAANAGLIVPVLVGPEAKIRAAAKEIKTDLSAYELVPDELTDVGGNDTGSQPARIVHGLVGKLVERGVWQTSGAAR